MILLIKKFWIKHKSRINFVNINIITVISIIVTVIGSTITVISIIISVHLINQNSDEIINIPNNTFENDSSVTNENFFQENIEKPQDDNERAKNIVQDYFNLKDTEISDFNSVWCDLTSTDQITEFYATYYCNKTEYITEYVTVFTIKNNYPENLFHQSSRPLFDLNGEHVFIDDTSYFMFTKIGGSLGTLYLYVFRYDGMGKLKLIHKEDSLYGGSLWIVDNHIYISGGNKRFELIRDSGEFILNKYFERVEYVEGSANHVLSYHIDNEEFIIKYDAAPINFIKEDDEYFSKKPIELFIDDQIVIDDNLFNIDYQKIRLLGSGEDFNSHPGFFLTLSPVNIGLKELSISYNYENWYIIEVLVKDLY